MKQTQSQLIKGLPRRIALMLLDCGLIALCYYLAVLLRFDGADAYKQPAVLQALVDYLPFALAVHVIVYWFGGLYEILWEYAGLRDLARLVLLCGLATGIIMMLSLIVRGDMVSGAVLTIGAVLSAAAMAGVRFLWRILRTYAAARGRGRAKKRRRAAPPMPLLIVGAGQAGAWAINLCKNQNGTFGEPVCIVDDDLTKKDLRVQGVPVRGTISDIPELVRKYHIVEIIIAITSLRGERLREVINLCNATHCRVRMLNDPQAVDENGKPMVPGLRELNTADFLSRDEIQLNDAQISSYLQGKVVLVTGGGGSIGSELCRQIMRYRPARLLIFDIYENCAYELETELRAKYGPNAPVLTLIGSIRDKARLDEVMQTYHPSVVFHAAAHKHVPLMETSPAEAVKNNVFGTKNLLNSAAEHGVERFVQLSTDKAVNPTNVMGCTKRICEMLIQTYARHTDMLCMAVRFGNVLGSHGSVIPLFEEQIKRGGPVTITHPDIVRYFMTIPEAAQLVLQAGGLAENGSIYVLDMGQPVRIMDLAKRIIRFYGYEPGVDMQIKVTGLRPGEKLYEELMLDTEQDKMLKTAHNKIFIAPPMEIDLPRFYTALQALQQSTEQGEEQVVEALQAIVGRYRPNRRVNEDHTVSAATGNTAIFAKAALEQAMANQAAAPQKE